MMNVLFVCGKNKLRSPTAEQIFSTYPGVDVASAGVNNDAESSLSTELVEWADIIFVMESVHKRKMSSKFQRSLKHKKVVCLDIPDNYDFMDPDLIRLLKKTVPPFLPHVTLVEDTE